MSTDSSSFDSSPLPPKPGMSGGIKVLLIVLAVVGLLILICCGGVIWMGTRVADQFEDATSTDPTVIASTTSEITQIDIPEHLSPKTSSDLPVPLTNQKMMTVVTYTGQQASDTMGMVEFGALFASQNESQIQQQLDLQLNPQGIGGTPSGNWQEETSQYEVEIRGETVSFDVTKLEDPDSGESRIQIKGKFQSQSGNPTFLVFNVDTDVVSEEQALEMLDSIQ